MFASEEELREHQRLEHQKDRFCPHCKARVRDQAALERHAKVCARKVEEDGASSASEVKSPPRKVIVSGVDVPELVNTGVVESEGQSGDPQPEGKLVDRNKNVVESVSESEDAESWDDEDNLCSISEGEQEVQEGPETESEESGGSESRDEEPVSTRDLERALGKDQSDEPKERSGSPEALPESKEAEKVVESDRCQEFGDLACRLARRAQEAGRWDIVEEFTDYARGWLDRLSRAGSGQVDTAKEAEEASQASSDSQAAPLAVSPELNAVESAPKAADSWMAVGIEGPVAVSPLDLFPKGAHASVRRVVSHGKRMPATEDRIGWGQEDDCLAGIHDPPTAWRTLARRNGFWQWSEHPAHLFHGAPSDAAAHQQLTMLQLVKQRARTGEGYKAVTLEEAGICSLRRTEEAVIPDPTEDDPGRTTNYRLCTDWMSTPAPKVTTQAATQIPEYFRISEGL